MSNVIGSDSPFTDDERQTLRRIAGLLIPASEEYGVPGADDPDISARILVMAAERAEAIQALLADLAGLANTRHNAEFLDLDLADQQALLSDSASARLLQAAIQFTATCYYQDGRVLVSIDLKDTPPFPDGHEIPEGDWSLLDPVRQRKPFYKRV